MRTHAATLGAKQTVYQFLGVYRRGILLTSGVCMAQASLSEGD